MANKKPGQNTGQRAEDQVYGSQPILRVLQLQSGFTMVELVTTVIIVGIVASMAAPRFFNGNIFESRGFYDEVVSTLRYAQQAAIAQNRFVCVGFSVNSVTLTTGADNSCTSNPGGSVNLGGPAGAAPYSVSNSRASFSPTPANFYFDALGRSSAAQSFGVSGYATPIKIETETGYVH